MPFLISDEEDPYETLKRALEIVGYKHHYWTIDGDFRAVSEPVPPVADCCALCAVRYFFFIMIVRKRGRFFIRNLLFWFGSQTLISINLNGCDCDR